MRGGAGRKLAWLITKRSLVRIQPPQPNMKDHYDLNNMESRPNPFAKILKDAPFELTARERAHIARIVTKRDWQASEEGEVWIEENGAYYFWAPGFDVGPHRSQLLYILQWLYGFMHHEAVGFRMDEYRDLAVMITQYVNERNIPALELLVLELKRLL